MKRGKSSQGACHRPSGITYRGLRASVEGDSWTVRDGKGSKVADVEDPGNGVYSGIARIGGKELIFKESRSFLKLLESLADRIKEVSGK